MSAPTTAGEACAWTHGSLIRGRVDQRFTSTVIDSREAGPGALFVAIVGPNHDAHRFVAEVLAAGAAGVLIQSDRIEDTLGPSDGFMNARLKDRHLRTRSADEIMRAARKAFA